MEVSDNKLHYYPTPRQWKARQVLDLDQVQPEDEPPIELLYGGGKGGGKTYFFCMWVLEYSRWVIKKFNLKPCKNPVHIGFMGRKLSVDFTGTTLATWRKIIPEECYEFRGSGDKEVKHVVIDGTVAVDYGGLDRQVNVNKFNSAEYGFIAIDQAEETVIDDVSVLKASRRLEIGGVPLPFRGLWTANPAACWLKDDFIISPQENHIFVQALPGDNEHLPKSYVNNLKASFKHRPELLQAYLYGSWDAFEGHAQVIKNIWLEEAKLRTCYPPVVKQYMVCDPARYGDDETVIYFMENAEIVWSKIMPHCRTTDISMFIAAQSRQNGDCTAVIESTGGDIGAGVIDELTEMGVTVLHYNPSSASLMKQVMGAGKGDNPVYKPIYHNLRAEVWCESAKILSSGILDKGYNILVECKNMYPTLQNQLCTPHYKFRNGKILIECKDDIKARIGRSPDHGDTYVIALWAWDKIEAMEEEERPVSYRQTERVGSPMRMC